MRNEGDQRIYTSREGGEESSSSSSRGYRRARDVQVCKYDDLFLKIV